MAFLTTTSDLLESIKDRAHVPASQSTYTNARFLELASEELWTYIVPMVLSTQEDYYVTTKDYTISGTSYTLPPRAIGGKLRDVVLVNSSGQELSVPRMDLSNQDVQRGTYFWLQGNKIRFAEAPTQPTLRVYYHIRPSQLIELTSCGRVTSVGSSTIEVDVAPSTFTTARAYDVVSGEAPHTLKQMDLAVTNVSGTTITFATLPDVAVGDYFCLAGEAPVVQTPYELIPLLAQRVAVKVMEAEGDLQGQQASQAALQRMEKAAFNLLQPRVDGEPQKIFNRSSDIRRLPRKWGFTYRM
jgi:hypothetical protein